MQIIYFGYTIHPCLRKKKKKKNQWMDYDYDNGGVMASVTQLEIGKIICLQIYSLQLKIFDWN